MRQEKIALRLLFILLFVSPMNSGFGNIISPRPVTNSSLSDFECKGDVLFNISLRDTIDLFASMFLIKAPWSDLEFTVKVKDSNRREYNYITSETESPIRYTVLELKTGISCSGRIDIKKELPRDCYSPKLHFTTVKDVTIQCLESTLPHDRGLPIPSYAKNRGQSGNNGYNISGWDSCGMVLLTYKDWIQDGSCKLGYDRWIDRTWTVINTAGRKTMTNEKIWVEYSTLEDLDSLRNYDGIDLPPLECDNSWPRLSSGTPDPTHTGYFHPQDFNCSNLEFIFEDSIIWNRNCRTPDIVYRKWTAYDWCSSMFRKQTQIIDIINCLPDTISPQARCKRKFSVNLLINQQVSLGIDAFNNGSKDNCNIKSISFNRNTEQDFITFYAKDVDKDSIVIMFVHDHIGNIDSCSTEVHILPYDGMDVGSIGGIAYDYQLKPITSGPNMIYSMTGLGNVTIDHDNCNRPSTHPNLSFSICPNDLHLYKLPFKLDLDAEDKYTSTTVLDMILIEGYLNGQEFNPFERKAADLNCNESISLSDVSALRKLLLNKDTLSKSCNDKWLFLEPNEKEITEIDHFSIPHMPKYNLDFVPVRLGDVNGSGLGQFTDAELINTTSDDVYMNIRNKIFNAGEEFTIWLEVLNPVDMEGIQFSLIFDENIIDIYDISSPQIPFTKKHSSIRNNNEIRIVYTNITNKSNVINGDWLAFETRAIQNGSILNALKHESFPIPPEIKVKDVNKNINLKLLIDGKGQKVVYMTLPNIDLIEGNEYDIELSSNPTPDIIGFQLGIKYDTTLIEIMDLSIDNKTIDPSRYSIIGNELRVVKSNMNDWRKLDGRWMKFRIRAKTNGMLADANFRAISELPNRLVDTSFGVVPFIIKIEDIVTSYNILNNMSSIVISPNPSQGDVSLTILSQKRITNSQLAIFNALGHLVYKNGSNKTNFVISKDKFPTSGLYYVVYESNLGKKVIKLVRL